MNTIETTDFAELYKNHMQQAQRTKKEPEHWDKRAEKMAENCADPNDHYLIKFREMMDFPMLKHYWMSAVDLALLVFMLLTSLKK